MIRFNPMRNELSNPSVARTCLSAYVRTKKFVQKGMMTKIIKASRQIGFCLEIKYDKG